MSFVQIEVDHLPLIVRNYPTKYLYTIAFKSMVASEDENNNWWNAKNRTISVN